jgi:hypothetical protein
MKQLTKWIACIALAIGCSSASKPTTSPETPPAGSSTAEPAAAPGSCTTAADCRLFSDYCTGCDCRALARGDKDPTCDGPGVRCVADPCMTKVAACVAGKCVANDKAPDKAP